MYGKKRMTDLKNRFGRGFRSFLGRAGMLGGFVVVCACTLMSASSLADDKPKKRSLLKAYEKQQSIMMAWQVLNIKKSGSSGKIEAIQTLNNYRMALDEVNLSCEAMGGGWEKKLKTCESRTYLAGVDAPKVRMQNANLSGVDLSRANFSKGRFFGTLFEGSQLRYADFESAELSGARFVDYSHSDGLSVARNLNQDTLDRTWAWEDNPPIFKVKDETGKMVGLDLNVLLYPKSLRAEYEASGQTGLPKGNPINKQDKPIAKPALKLKGDKKSEKAPGFTELE